MRRGRPPPHADAPVILTWNASLMRMFDGFRSRCRIVGLAWMQHAIIANVRWRNRAAGATAREWDRAADATIPRMRRTVMASRTQPMICAPVAVEVHHAGGDAFDDVDHQLDRKVAPDHPVEGPLQPSPGADVAGVGPSPGVNAGGDGPSPGADVARGEPSPGADVARGEPSPGADVGRDGPSPGADVAAVRRANGRPASCTP